MIVPAAAAVLTLSVAGYVYLHRAPTLTEKDTIVLADFENKTGDPVFDDTLRQGLSVELQQSPFLSLISDGQVQRTLALMGQPKDARLTPEIAQQICERTGKRRCSGRLDRQPWKPICIGLARKALQYGQYPGSRADPGGKTRGCPEFPQSDRAQFQNPGGRIAGDGGKALDAACRGYDTVTRSSQGLQHRNKGEPIRPAVRRPYPFFRRAIEIDPQFAIAYANLGLGYGEWSVGVVGRERDKSLATRGIEPAIGRSFSSTLPTTGRSREIWKGPTKPSSRGFRPILAGTSHQVPTIY